MQLIALGISKYRSEHLHLCFPVSWRLEFNVQVTHYVLETSHVSQV
jgi:hypothetical protein